MTDLTPEEARSLLCPLARTFATKDAVTGCRGPECAVWRWEKITTSHPAWMPAVRSVASEIGEKPPYPKASKIVADDLVKYGMTEDRGHCGLGGQ